MSRSRVARFLLLWGAGLVSVAVLSTCSFVIDVDKLGDGECASSSKLCEGACVPLTLPKYGCAQTGCIPCSLGNAQAICVAGKCAVAACNGTNKDCNGVAADGCEIDTDHDPNHCGSCDANPCIVSNATPDCAAGRCVVRSCNAGFGDCDADSMNGCETDLLGNAAHCGKCTTSCPAGKTCQAGQCI